jgi:hypothetical protein
MKLFGTVVGYAVFFALLGLLSVQPDLRLLDTEEAIVSLSFSHAAKRVGECRQLSQEELLALPPNMRQPEKCPRERHPLHVELFMDDTPLYEATLPPSGLWKDGKSTAYQRIRVQAGSHYFQVRMNDSGVPGRVDFEKSVTLDVRPGQNLVVLFDPDNQQFRFQ